MTLPANKAVMALAAAFATSLAVATASPHVRAGDEIDIFVPVATPIAAADTVFGIPYSGPSDTVSATVEKSSLRLSPRDSRETTPPAAEPVRPGTRRVEYQRALAAVPFEMMTSKRVIIGGKSFGIGDAFGVNLPLADIDETFAGSEAGDELVPCVFRILGIQGAAITLQVEAAPQYPAKAQRIRYLFQSTGSRKAP